MRAFMPQRTEQDIAKRYDIDTREFATGGYGKVYIAKDREFKDRTVCIKKVVKADPQKTEAFHKEVHIMRDLDHPNICKLLETYEEGRFMYFVMEYCEGREVFDRIMEQGNISEKLTVDIIKQVASALRYAHDRGIAHRDMKPENICFCSNDPKSTQVKVIDWGLGFYFGQARMISAVGSLTYAAPEVMEAGRHQYGPECDLWSLGVVTYVMLCGKPPFWGSHSELLKRMKREDYPISDPPWPSISSDAKNFIQVLLKRDPRKRLPINKVLDHKWLLGHVPDTNKGVQMEVLRNMRKFSNNNAFFNMCVASVARQLDHKSLTSVHQVFSSLDQNGDGVLELHEVKAGFAKLFGEDSQEVRDVEEMFKRLDLDGSGTIDYTEFCAAGIGEQMSMQEHVLWAAFKTFDVNDDDGTISVDEIMQVLQRADVNKVWSKSVCEEVAREIVSNADKDGNGTIDFDEWLQLMRESSRRVASNESEVPGVERQLAEDLERAGQQGNIDEAYQLLAKMSSKGKSTAVRSQSASGGQTLMRAITDRLAQSMGRPGTPTCGLHDCSVM